MADLVTEIKGRLKGDSQITIALGYLVWDYWLTPGRPAEAFDPQAGGRLRKNIVILDGGEVEHPSLGRAKTRLWDSFPQIYIYGPAHETGKQAVRAAKMRVEQLIAPWRTNVDTGTNVTFQLDNVIALEDSELFPGNVVSIMRWRATGARRIA